MSDNQKTPRKTAQVNSERAAAGGSGAHAADLLLQQWFNLSDPAVEEALYDSAVMRQFVGIDPGCEPVPDNTRVCKFRHLLEEHRLGEQILSTVNLHLQAYGVRITRHDRRGNPPARAHFDQESETAARSRDAPDEEGQATVLRDEGAPGGRSQDQNYPHGGGDGGQRRRFGAAARSIARRRDASVGRSGLPRTGRSDSSRRYRYEDRVDEVERAKNRTKSTVRLKVEQVFAVMKLQCGFVKLRYRGLKKNANQLFAVCALVNLCLLRKKLLLLASA
jgi:IS5 family transposase